jgi:transposase-like protein
MLGPSSVASSTNSGAAASDLLDQAATDVLAYSAFPRGCWRQIWSNNPQQRLNRGREPSSRDAAPDYGL